MARNSEKALSMMNKWVAMKSQEHYARYHKEEVRPDNPNHVKSIQDCEKWRRQLLAEIASKIVKVQNLGLSKDDSLSLNDEINNLLVVKSKWEQRIQTLGGPDYSFVSSKLLQEATYSPSASLYFFGSAKQYMPVLASPTVESKETISRSKLISIANSFYFGFNDESEELLEAESKAESAVMNT
ncbi:hypothetical protein GEMRC1_004306 [Eukaryota sp. GEM-RC1]